jgi:ABC-2 type transport system ATP-binding protein
MNTQVEGRKQEAILNLQQGNRDLAFRQLLDLALDTQDQKAFTDCIAFTDWKYQNPENVEGFEQRMLEVLQQLPLHTIQPPAQDTAIIQADGVMKRYGNNRFQLGPVTLSIVPGHLIGLVGENGNGKTTLLRMLAHDLALSEGQIHYRFHTGGDEYDLRSQLIYIPQRTPKWHGKVKDNLMFTATHYGIAPEQNESYVLMMMIRFGLWEFRNHSWNELSSGYKMRFELARTFLRRPKLLLLDEPLANLDILSQQLILEDLRMLGKSIQFPLGIILSSQQLYEVEKVSDEVVFLKQGKPSSFNSLKEDNTEENLLVIELDIVNSREELLAALEGLAIKELKLLGSNYYIEMQGTQMTEVLLRIAQANIQVNYFRNISTSTRRFFN